MREGGVQGGRSLNSLLTSLSRNGRRAEETNGGSWRG